MQKKPSIPPAGEAILAGDIEAMRRLAEDGSLLFKKGKVVELRRNIPTVIQDGKRILLFTPTPLALLWPITRRKLPNC